MSTRTVFTVSANGPFDRDAVVANLSSHAVSGLQHFDAETQVLSRWIKVAGTQQFVQVQLVDAHLVVTTDSMDPGINDAIAQRVRFWFDLDTDLAPVNAHLAQDPLFAPQVSQRPGIRITRHHAPFEGTIMAVLGQQVTLATGRLFAARLVDAYGIMPTGKIPSWATLAQDLRIFPSAHAIANAPMQELRAALKLTNARARTVSEVAKLFADHGAHAEHETFPNREELAAVYGIGPWTLDVLAIRATADKDAFPASDAVLRRMMAAVEPGLGEDKKKDATRSARWRPYRSYAAQRLWAMLN